MPKGTKEKNRSIQAGGKSARRVQPPPTGPDGHPLIDVTAWAVAVRDRLPTGPMETIALISAKILKETTVGVTRRLWAVIDVDGEGAGDSGSLAKQGESTGKRAEAVIALAIKAHVSMMELTGGPLFVRFWLPMVVVDQHGGTKTENLHLRVHHPEWLEIGFVEEFAADV